MVKLKIDNSSEDYAAMSSLMKQVARNDSEGLAAREAVAAFVGPTIDQVLQQQATHRAFYQKFTYNFGDGAEVPLDLFDSNEEGLFDVWSTSIPGGLATNHLSGGDEFRMTTFRYDTALSMLRRNAEKGRFDLLVRSMERAAQELMVKEKYQAWTTMLRALGGARTNGDPHVIDATTADVFQLDDVNRLQTKVSRLRNSWLGGTPSEMVGSGVTHMVVSPEIMEQVRSWVYQPMNTRGVPDDAESTAVPLPDQIRNSIYENAGLASIPGVGAFIQLNNLGDGQSYNSVFDSAYTPGGGEPGFTAASDQIVLAVDLSLPGGVQMVAADSERGEEVVFEDDDQFTKRSGKIGWFGGMESGFAWLDVKTLAGVIV